MKFLHCSDLHLGKRPGYGSEIFRQKRFRDYFTAFERILELAKTLCTDAILIAGDMFDKRETQPEILRQTEYLLQCCQDANIAVVVVEGNHDLITRNREHESWLIYLEKNGLLIRPSIQFDETGERHYDSKIINGTEIYGLGYPGASVDEELKHFTEYCHKNDKKNCVVLIHTALGNNEFLGGFIAEKTVLDGLAEYVDYIAGGHRHQLQTYPHDNPFFFVPGSPEYYDLGEETDKKNVILFDTVTKTYQTFLQQPRNCIKKEILLHSKTNEEFMEEMKKQFDETKITEEDIVCVKLECLQHEFIPDIRWAEKFLCEERNALFAKVEWKQAKSARADVTKILRTVEEIELQQISKWDNWKNAAETAVQALGEMKTAVRDKKELYDIFDSALNQLLINS